MKIAFFVLVSGLLGGLFSPLFAQTQKAGDVILAQGTMKILRADGVSTEVAKVGTQIFVGDRLETDAVSIAKIRFVDDSVMSVGKNTTLKITQYLFSASAKQRNTDIFLIAGVIRMKVESYFQWAASSYEVRTGAAVGGVRGTDFVVQVLSNGTSEYYLIEGALELRGTEGIRQVVRLAPQQFSRVALGAPPSVPLRFEPGAKAQMFQNLGETPPGGLPKGTTAKGPGGDQRISQGDWARMLGNSMGLAKSGIQEGLDSAAYADLLAGGSGRVIEAEDFADLSKYLTKEQGAPDKVSGNGYLEAKSLSGTLRLNVAVPSPGKYPVKVKSRGTLLVSINNQSNVVETPPDDKSLRWQTLGQYQLQPGINEVNIVVSKGAAIDAFQIDARCADSIAPTGGWNVGQGLNYAAKAETMVKAMDQQGNLPVDGTYSQILRAENSGAPKGDFNKVDIGITDASGNTMKKRAVKAGAGTATLGWNITLPSDGVYSFSMQAGGSAPVILSMDGCEIGRAVPQGGEVRAVWEDIATRGGNKGNHSLEVMVPSGATLEAVRIIRRNSSPADYLALLKNLGFKEGKADDPVSEASAKENLQNQFFQAFAGEQTPQEPGEIAAGPDQVDEPPPDFHQDDQFPGGSSASPVVPGF